MSGRHSGSIRGGFTTRSMEAGHNLDALRSDICMSSCLHLSMSYTDIGLSAREVQARPTSTTAPRCQILPNRYRKTNEVRSFPSMTYGSESTSKQLSRCYFSVAVLHLSEGHDVRGSHRDCAGVELYPLDKLHRLR